MRMSVSAGVDVYGSAGNVVVWALCQPERGEQAVAVSSRRGNDYRLSLNARTFLDGGANGTH